jgi:hypothetical protein
MISAPKKLIKKTIFVRIVTKIALIVQKML